MPALIAACNDAILAVRVHAAGTLAAVAEYILESTHTPLQDGDLSSATPFIDILFPTALAAAGDHDKVRADGIHALATLLHIQLKLVDAGQPGRDDYVIPAIEALMACLGSQNAKVQWSACAGAGAVCTALAAGCSALEAADLLEALISLLLELSESSENSRTRLLAADAVGKAGACLRGKGILGQRVSRTSFRSPK